MKIYPFFLHNAGCRHRCLFCNQQRSVASARLPTPAEVSARLDEHLPQQGDGEAAFYGGSFTMLDTARQRGYLDAAARFVRQGRIRGIRISTRPDALQQSAIDLLLEYGVTTVEVGCQSFDDQVLMRTQRGHLAANGRDAIKRCLSAGVQVGVQLMPGLPGGSPDEAFASARQAIALRPSFMRIYPAVVIAGTGLAEEWRCGTYQPWPLDLAVEVCADILCACRKGDIPVIRVGLQQDEQLQKNLLAGPYHPAFGQLVRSRLWRRALAGLADDEREISVNPVDFSDALGHAGVNRQWFAQQERSLRLHADRTVMPGFLKTVNREQSLTQVLTAGEHG